MSELTIGIASELALWHLRGSGSLAALAGAGYAVPEQWFTLAQRDGLEFVARLGKRECLVLGSAATPLDEVLAAGGTADIHVFPRDDSKLLLTGSGWQALMLEICSYDFSLARPGQFIMSAAAGISIWSCLPAEHDGLLVGCDPSYQDYLSDTLNQVLHDIQTNQSSGEQS
jgi:hypothetical protein